MVREELPAQHVRDPEVVVQAGRLVRIQLVRSVLLMDILLGLVVFMEVGLLEIEEIHLLKAFRFPVGPALFEFCGPVLHGNFHLQKFAPLMIKGEAQFLLNRGFIVGLLPQVLRA
jgi:hypothetical protein